MAGRTSLAHRIRRDTELSVTQWPFRVWVGYSSDWFDATERFGRPHECFGTPEGARGPEMRCHTWKGVHIPGCMSCATLGHHRCTCPPKAITLTRLAKQLDDLRERVERLEAQRGT